MPPRNRYPDTALTTQLSQRHGDHAPRGFADVARAETIGLLLHGEEVVSVDFTQNPKVLTTAFNEYRAKSVIIATGARPRKLGLELEEDLQGRGRLPAPDIRR